MQMKSILRLVILSFLSISSTTSESATGSYTGKNATTKSKPQVEALIKKGFYPVLRKIRSCTYDKYTHVIFTVDYDEVKISKKQYEKNGKIKKLIGFAYGTDEKLYLKEIQKIINDGYKVVDVCMFKTPFGTGKVAILNFPH